MMQVYVNGRMALRILVNRPEIEVAVRRQKVEVSHDTLRGRIAKLIADGWFAEPKTGSSIETEMRRQSFPCGRSTCYKEADRLATDGFLRKTPDGGYQEVSGMRVYIVDAA